MDVISYGVAAKASNQEKNTRNNVLGLGVQGIYLNTKERIDAIEKDFTSGSELVNDLIIKDAINIMKANAKLNAIAKTTKYNMHQMIFDDLLDTSNIDMSNSQNYSHNAVKGCLIASMDCVIVTKTEIVTTNVTKAILVIEENTKPIVGHYYVSRNNGITWEAINPETLFYFSELISPLGSNLKIKAELPTGTELLSYAITWI